jgi:Fur family transcriptional regulator, ferric uptake regulator
MMKKYKNTKTRNLVLNKLSNSSLPISAYDIYNSLIENKITLSTIYRTLQTFLENEIIDKMEDEKGVSLYYIPKDEHSHYLECKSCHKRVKIDICPYDDFKKKIKDTNGFTLSDENIVLYGLCDKCNKNKKD